jgi:hypothetical protein
MTVASSSNPIRANRKDLSPPKNNGTSTRQDCADSAKTPVGRKRAPILLPAQTWCQGEESFASPMLDFGDFVAALTGFAL